MLTAHYGLILSSASTLEVVTSSDLKDFLRITSTETADDALVMSLQTAVRKRVEERWSRSCFRQLYTLSLDAFPVSSTEAIALPKTPLVDSTDIAITLYNTTGGSSAWSTSEYLVDVASEPGRIMCQDDYDWPDDANLRSRAGIVITFRAGYSSSSGGPVPEGIAQAIKCGVAHLYEHRGDEAMDLDSVLSIWDSEFDLSECG